jgi:hypothetical protein
MTKEENKYKEFVLYFRELDVMGIPYGMRDLRIKAEELGLPIPSREEIDKLKIAQIRKSNK